MGRCIGLLSRGKAQSLAICCLVKLIFAFLWTRSNLSAKLSEKRARDLIIVNVCVTLVGLAPILKWLEALCPYAAQVLLLFALFEAALFEAIATKAFASVY